MRRTGASSSATSTVPPSPAPTSDSSARGTPMLAPPLAAGSHSLTGVLPAAFEAAPFNARVQYHVTYAATVNGRPVPAEEIVAKVDAVTAGDVVRAAERLFRTKPTLSAIGPLANLEAGDAFAARLSA